MHSHPPMLSTPRLQQHRSSYQHSRSKAENKWSKKRPRLPRFLRPFVVQYKGDIGIWEEVNVGCKKDVIERLSLGSGTIGFLLASESAGTSSIQGIHLHYQLIFVNLNVKECGPG